MGFGTCFKYPLISYEIGMMKPDAEIFVHAIKIANCEPSRILFFDDNEVNVQNANDCGLTAIYVRGFNELTGRLNELGLMT
ncbi:MAG: HAD-IA family hydrolase [Pseudomonadota bacterium]